MDRARRAFPLLLACSLATSAPAQDEAVGARVVASGWAVDPGAEAGLASLELDLAEDVRLDAFYSSAGPLGYGELRWGSWRVAGGWLGDDAGGHLGWAPTLSARLHDHLTLSGGLDLSLGLARLEGRDAVPTQAWEDAPDAIDLWLGAARFDARMRFRPWRRLELSIGGYADAVLALAPPGEDPLLQDHVSLSDDLDLSLAAAHSDAAVGAHAVARGTVFQGRTPQGRLELDLSYREAWDWIHVDPAIEVLDRSGVLEPLEVQGIPWRTTRRAGLTARLRSSAGVQVGLGVDGQHRQGSTTQLDFTDRNGWSVGVHAAARVGRVSAEVSARHHLSPSPLEELWGDIPDTSVSGRLGVVLAEGHTARALVEARARYTLADDFGVPREGSLLACALVVEWGAVSPPRWRPDPVTLASLDWVRPLPTLPRVAQAAGPPGPAPPEATSSDPLPPQPMPRPRPGPQPQPPASPPAPSTAPPGHPGLPPAQAPPTDLPSAAEAREIARDLDLEGDLDELLRETDLEDLEDLLREPLSGRGDLAERIDQVLTRLDTPLALGYTRTGLRLGLVHRATADAITRRLPELEGYARLPSVASLDAILGRFDPEAGVGGVSGAVLTPDVATFARGEQLQALTLLRPRKGRHRVLIQLRSQRARLLRRLTTGR